MNDGTDVKGMRGVDLTQMVRGVGGVSVCACQLPEEWYSPEKSGE